MNPGRGPMQKTGRGIPQAFQSPLNQAKKKDVMSGDQLPSYTENTTTNKNSVSGSGTSTRSMTQSKESASGSNSKKKKSSKKLPGYDKAYDALSPKKKSTLSREQFTADAMAYNAKKKAAAGNPSKSSNDKKKVESRAKKDSSTTSSTTRSKTTSIGTQTKNQVKAKGVEKKVNARSKRSAEKQAAIIRAKSDSTNVSNASRKASTRGGRIPLKKDIADKITAKANSVGRKSLRGALGKDGATKAFPSYSTSSNKGNSAKARSGTEGGVFTEEDFQ